MKNYRLKRSQESLLTASHRCNPDPDAWA